jgi:hypothetical protein
MKKEQLKIELIEIEKKIDGKIIAAWEKIKSIKTEFHRESHETVVASKILFHIIEMQEVSPEQVAFLKSQSLDIGKALAIIGLQAIPGSCIAIITLEKIGEKHGFTLFPQKQIEPGMEEEGGE